MEPATRFNLSHAVREWRGELQQQASLGEDAIRELDQHLAESMDALRHRGLDEEEAFLVARHRIGPTTPLGAEFRKADPVGVWRHRILWMVAGWGTMMLWGGLMSPVQFIATLRFSSAAAPHPLSQVGSFLIYLLTSLIPLGFAVLLVRGRFVGVPERLTPLFASRRRAGITVAILGTLILGAWQSLPFLWGPMHSSTFSSSSFGLLLAMGVSAVIQGTLFGLLTAWLMPKPLSAQTT